MKSIDLKCACEEIYFEQISKFEKSYFTTVKLLIELVNSRPSPNSGGYSPEEIGHRISITKKLRSFEKEFELPKTVVKKIDNKEETVDFKTLDDLPAEFLSRKKVLKLEDEEYALIKEIIEERNKNKNWGIVSEFLLNTIKQFKS